MKIKTYICMIAAMLFIVSGCGSATKEKVDKYIAGHVEGITTAQVMEKIENKEDFTIVFTQTGCTHCKTFMKMLNEYLPDHNLVLYDLILDKEPNREEALTQLEASFPEFTGTPDIYCVEDGKIKSRFWNEGYSGLEESTFNEWVEKYNLLGT